MDEAFGREALDRLLMGKVQGDMRDIAAAWKVLRDWMLGGEILQLLLERGTLVHASDDCATFAFADGSSLTVYPEGTWEMGDGVLRYSWLLLMQVLSPAWRV